jgi:hypothetical protein
MRGLRRFTKKPLGYLVEQQNQDRRLRERRRDPGTPRSFDACGRVAGSQVLCREEAVCGNGVTVRWRGVLHDLFAPEGLYHNFSARGSVVFCLARKGLIYISSRVSRQTIHLECFSFSCSLGLDFSSVCKESDLRVNGSFHGCVDFRFVARWIFVSFSSYFRRFFVRGLFIWLWCVWPRICWWESWIVASCIFVLDLDPPNFEFVLPLKDFGWVLGFWLFSVAIRFPATYVVWGPKFWGIASPRDASHLPQIFPRELQPFGRSMEG